MSSSSSKKVDLLVKVRYQNPLPPPPFPPRLLNIKTSPERYTGYDFLVPLCQERELPVILDGELGIPLELGKIRKGEWGDGKYFTGDRTEIAPAPGAAGPLPDEDAFLFTETSSTAVVGSMPNTPGGGGVMGERRKVDVSWLRRTEYLSSEAGSKLNPTNSNTSTPVKPSLEELEAPSRDRRAATIAATFTALQSSSLADLRHPTKKHLRVAESYTVLPDEKLWANTMSMVKFGEDPGEPKPGEMRPVGRTGADARLPRALFRPLEVNGKLEAIGYFLPDNDETAEAYEARRREGHETAPESEAFEFKYIRDYEIAKQKALTKEYVITFVDAPAEGVDTTQTTGGRPKGAFYGVIGQSQVLRKRRPRKGENPKIFSQELVDAGFEFWDGISVKVKGLNVLEDEERTDREDLEAELTQAPARL